MPKVISGGGRFFASLTDEQRQKIASSPIVQRWRAANLQKQQQHEDQMQHQVDPITAVEQRSYLSALRGYCPDEHQQNSQLQTPIRNQNQQKQNQNQKQNVAAASLARICKPLGRLIALDSATERRTRSSVAKIKLEIDVSKPLIDKLWLEIEGEGMESDNFWQNIEYENPPKFCRNCSRIGHDLNECRRREAVVEGRGAPTVKGGGPAKVVATVGEASGEHVDEAAEDAAAIVGDRPNLVELQLLEQGLRVWAGSHGLMRHMVL